MLSRVVARSLTARLAISRVALTSRYHGSYSKPSKPPPNRDTTNDTKPSGDYLRGNEHRWQQYLNPEASTWGNSSGKEEFRKEQPEYDAQAAPERNQTEEPGVEPNPNEVNKPLKSDISSSQPEFQSPQNPEANTAPETEPQTPEPARPSQPLPDLRHGIPSTFAEEFLKQPAAGRPAPDAPAEQADQVRTPPGLNITDATESTSSGGGGRRDDGELPKSAYETSNERRRNRVANYMYLIFGGVSAATAVFLGRNWDTVEEEQAYPNAPSGWGPVLFYQRALARVSSQLGYYTEPTFPKLLPEYEPRQPYTLVISMEDMMLHSEWSREHGWRTAKRPGLDMFLRYLHQYYELVLWTTQPYMMTEPIIKKLDPFHLIMWPLFREATRFEKGEHVKDLSFLNRDLSKVILLDSKAVHAKHQPENAIILPPWKGDPQDRELLAMIPFLEYLATSGHADFRRVLDTFKGTHLPSEFARREARAREAHQKKLEEERGTGKRGRRSGAGSRFLSSAMGIQPGLGGELDSDAFVGDLIRARGMAQYKALEKELQENGEKILKEMEEEEKAMQDEQMKSMRSGFFSYFGAVGRGAGEPATGTASEAASSSGDKTA